MNEFEKNFIRKVRKLPFFKRTLLPSQKIFHLHTIISSCGHELVDAHEYSHHGLKRGNKPFASFQYTLAGEGALVFEEQRHTLSAGKALLGIVPHNHRYYLPTRSKNWEFVYITFAGSEALRILHTIQRTKGPVFTLNSLESFTIFENILSHAQYQSHNVFLTSAMGYSLLLSLLSEIHATTINFSNNKIKMAMGFCKNNYQRTVHIKDIARHINISQFHLARMFHKETGITIQQYIEKIRMGHALQAITTTDKTIKEVALDCGFSNTSYFTKVFKKHYQYNPSHYQRR